MHVLTPKVTAPSPEYFLGIINSRLLNWYYHSLNPEMGEALAEVKKTNIARLPIKIVNLNNRSDRRFHDKLVSLVDRMMDLNKKKLKAKTPHIREVLHRQADSADRQLNRLVYELYELTEEEIEIVEKGNP